MIRVIEWTLQNIYANTRHYIIYTFKDDDDFFVVVCLFNRCGFITAIYHFKNNKINRNKTCQLLNHSCRKISLMIWIFA